MYKQMESILVKKEKNLVELVETDKISLIMRQTNYTEEETIKKLAEFENNEIKVIKNYMGITEKKDVIKSINQEIYKQLRYKLDSSIRSYNNEQQEKLLEEIKKNK